MTRLETAETRHVISTCSMTKIFLYSPRVCTGSVSYSNNSTGDVDLQSTTHLNLVPKSSRVDSLQSSAKMNWSGTVGRNHGMF